MLQTCLLQTQHDFAIGLIQIRFSPKRTSWPYMFEKLCGFPGTLSVRINVDAHTKGRLQVAAPAAGFGTNYRDNQEDVRASSQFKLGKRTNS
jgi:hypothetical protein